MFLGCCVCNRERFVASSVSSGSSGSSSSGSVSTVSPTCTPGCSVLPRRWQVTVGGLVDQGWASCCDEINGTYILHWYPDRGSPGLTCSWRSDERQVQQLGLLPTNNCGTGALERVRLNISTSNVTLTIRAILFGNFGFSEVISYFDFINNNGLNPNVDMSTFNCLTSNTLYHRPAFGLQSVCTWVNGQTISIEPAP